MATLILGLVGSVVAPEIFGPMIFGMSSSSLGYFFGSSIGSFLQGPTVLPPVYGPRVADLKFQTASQGNAIPKAYGTVRVAGNVIWAQNIVETAHTSKVKSGKGGGKTKQTVTTYTYSCSYAVGLCAGPITGIQRMWANGTLIYDVSPSASVASAVGSHQFSSDIRVYPGSATQNPDALIQADKGAANTPAFRNLAYVVFDALQLAQFGNRVPSIEAEVIVPSYGPALSAGVNPGNESANPGFTGYYVEPQNAFYANQIDGQGIFKKAVPGYKFNGTYYSFESYGMRSVVGTIISTESKSINTGIYNLPSLITKFARFSPGDSEYCVASTADATSKYVYLDWEKLTYQVIDASAIPVSPFANYVYYAAKSGNDLYIVTHEVDPVGTVFCRIYWVDLSQGALVMVYLRDAVQISAGIPEMIFADSNYWYAIKTDAIRTYTRASATLVATTAATTADPKMLWRVNGGWYHQNGYSIHFVSDAGVDTTLGSVRSTALGWTDCSYYGLGVFAVTDANSAGGVPYTLNTAWYAPANGTASAPALSSIVQDIATTTGLTAGDLDITQLTDNVTGYVVSKQMTGRAAIEPLMPAFYFDAVETDNVLRFVKRGALAVASLVDADIAAHEYGSQAPEPLVHTRVDDSQLPSRMEVTYISLGSDYQIGVQAAQRQAARALQQVQMQVPLVMTDDQAAQIAEVNCFAAWINRDQYKFAAGPKFLYLDPTDVVTVSFAGVTVNMRITKADEFSSPGVTTYEGVAESTPAYSSSAVGAALPSQQQTVSPTGPTAAAFLDIPLLLDQNDYLGFYLAMSGYVPGWPGAQLFASSDGGQSYVASQDSLEVSPGATMGVTTTALGTCAAGRYETFDWANSVTVKLNQGTLSNATRDQIFNSFANACVVGQEVIQFLNATLVSTGIYTLTGLLRGRLGSTWADGAHAVGDTFVLLDTGTTLRIRDVSTNLNASAPYKPTTLGAALQDTSVVNFTNTAASLKPLPPVQIGGGRDASNNLTVIWNRQTRYQNVLQAFIGSPLGEASEAYDVDIIKAGVPVRTISVTSPTASYTAAQQTTDGLTPGNPVSLKVYQKSAAVGRGFPTAATV